MRKDRHRLLHAVRSRRAGQVLHRPALRPRRSGFPVVSAVVLGLILCGCLLAGLFTDSQALRLDPAQISLPPGSRHWFGTDPLGRDLWAVLWRGGRTSLLLGALATLLSTLIAILYGTISGLAAPRLDALMMRFAEILLSIPSLLLILFLQAVIGQRSLWGIALVIGITGWMSIAKMIRTEVRTLRTAEYVLLSQRMGASFLHVLWRHLLPGFRSTIMFMVVMNVRTAIVAESTLSFLGLGLPVDILTWGSMLSLSETALLTGAWWIILIPGFFLILTLLCITDLGEWLRGGGGRLHGNL